MLTTIALLDTSTTTDDDIAQVTTAEIVPIIELTVNEVDGNDVTMGMTSTSPLLRTEDYIPMTPDEALIYYGVELPIGEIFPNFGLTDSRFGIYANENGAYRDANGFTYANGEQSLEIMLSKAMTVGSGIAYYVKLEDDRLEFSTVNGRELAVFHYTGDGDHFHVHFFQNGVIYHVTSNNIPRDDFAGVLAVLVDGGESVFASRALTGSVTAIDANAGLITVSPDEGQGYRGYVVYPPPEEMEKMTKLPSGQRIVITYAGEPATAGCIWRQQLVGIGAVD